MNSVFSIYQNGPAPFETQFESQVEGSALVFLCGSCWRSSTGLGGLSLTIDGNPVAETQIYINETNSHVALPPVLVEIGDITVGPHTLGIHMTNGDMTTDRNDYFSAGVFFF